MSDTFLNIIPTTPTYVPSQDSQDNARALLHSIFKEKEIEFTTTDTVEFIDQGENFESVSCNLCGHAFELEDWQDAMDKAYEQRFSDLQFSTPCCNKVTSLNHLDYKWPAGFAKFTIRIVNPKDALDPADLAELQKILDTPLRIVWAHI